VEHLWDKKGQNMKVTIANNKGYNKNGCRTRNVLSPQPEKYISIEYVEQHECWAMWW